jgi:RecA/RadA recombinase
VGGGVGHGFPFGKIINIVGDKSSGKTFLSLEIVAAAYHRYGKKLRWLYDDAESGFTFDTENLYGFQVFPDEEPVHSRTVEELYVNYRTFLDSLKPGEVGVYVVDSLDGLSNEEIEQRGEDRVKAAKAGRSYSKGSYGMATPRFLSQEFFRTLTDETKDRNVLLIIVSQTRDAIDSMFKTQTRSGGKALDFYAHTVLWLSHLTDIKIKNRPVGAVVKAKAKKSKTPRPRREAVFSFMFDYGLDDIGSSIDFLFGLRGKRGELLEAAKAIVWDGGGRKADLSGLKAWMEETGKLEWYRENVNRTLRKSEVLAWIESDPEVAAAYESAFGTPRSRAELIAHVESNGLEKELRDRVRAKWEAIEESIRSGRKRKYSDE